MLKRFVLLKGYQIPFTLPCVPLVIIDNIGPVTQGPYQAVLDGYLVGTFTKEIIGDMQFPLVLRYSCLLAKYAVTLESMIIVVIIDLLFAIRHDNSTCILINWHLSGVVAVIINRHCLRSCKTLDTSGRSLHVILNLHGG